MAARAGIAPVEFRLKHLKDEKMRDAAKAGMICGGACTMLMEPILPDGAADVYAALAQCEADGTRAVVLAVWPDRLDFRKLVLLPDGTLIGSTGDAGTDALVRKLAEQHGAGETPDLVENVCIQPLLSSSALCLPGAGYVAIPVEHLARLVGFRTTLIDDRPEFADPRRFRKAAQGLAVPVGPGIGASTVLIAVRRGRSAQATSVGQSLRPVDLRSELSDNCHGNC